MGVGKAYEGHVVKWKEILESKAASTLGVLPPRRDPTLERTPSPFYVVFSKIMNSKEILESKATRNDRLCTFKMTDYIIVRNASFNYFTLKMTG